MDFLPLVIAATPAEPSLGAVILGYLWMILIVGLGLGFVIFVHELGHFLVAKAVGVKCEKFYVGFDFFEIKLGPITIPRALWKRKWGETEYGIGILPLGGYVKMLGQDDDPRNAAAEAERIRVANGEAPSDAAPFNPDDVRTSELAKGTSAEGMVSGQTVETPNRPFQLDPRSYPAKSVPARMAIISAGVIMNLIFAVVFAAIAYKMGVTEVPAVVGATVPGDPAWTAGLEPGDKIIQIGHSGSEYEHLRFEDLMKGIAFNGSDRDLSLYIRKPNGKEDWFEIRPSTRLASVKDFPALGVAPASSNKLRAPLAGEHLAQTSVPLEARDLVVAIDGQEVKEGMHYEVPAMLARRPTGPLTITIERIEKKDGKTPTTEADKQAATKRMDVVVEQLPLRELGLSMEMGPIVAIRHGSPAETAGFLVGDVIESIDGQPVSNPLTLGQSLIPRIGEPIKFTVTRKDRNDKPQSLDLTATMEAPQNVGIDGGSGGPAAIEGIGVAFDIRPVVAAVEEGGPADRAGLRPGDTIDSLEFIATDEAAIGFNEKRGFKDEPIVLDDEFRTWTYVNYLLQMMHPDTSLKLNYTRDKKAYNASVKYVESKTAVDSSRGLTFYPDTYEHVAADWGEAGQLGVRETKERLTEVVTVLQRLVTGQISPKNLSGPIGIMQGAGAAASAGFPTMLMFLTLLSANLAVLNFLPIPALDGGHMLFLAAEGVRGKPVDEQLQLRLTVAGVLCLLSLMVFATMMDFSRFFR